MTRGFVTLAFAGVGLLFNLLSILLANQLHIIPYFPAYGGDDDFNLRAAVYFLWVCPAFIVVGAVIGHAFHDRWNRILRAWLGVSAVTIVVFASVRACAPWIERIDSRDGANVAAIAFLSMWPLATALGAALVAGKT